MTTMPLTFETLRSKLRFRGDLVARTGLRIGAGRDTDVAGHDLPVMRDAAGRPFIPGASFKGALRASLEALLRGLSDTQQDRLACFVLERERRCISDRQMETWRNNEKTRRPEQLAALVAARSCLICQTFGSPWLSSHIAVRDLAVVRELWFGQFEVRQGVSLDRDTETAREGQLYSFETVPPGTRFRLEIEADNLLPWQRGLLLLGLRPFARGEFGLGGARSRGLGLVELLEGEWRGWELSEPRAASIMAFLRDDLAPLDTEAQTSWQQALLAKLEEAGRA